MYRHSMRMQVVGDPGFSLGKILKGGFKLATGIGSFIASGGPLAALGRAGIQAGAVRLPAPMQAMVNAPLTGGPALRATSPITSGGRGHTLGASHAKGGAISVTGEQYAKGQKVVLPDGSVGTVSRKRRHIQWANTHALARAERRIHSAVQHMTKYIRWVHPKKEGHAAPKFGRKRK